MECTGDQLWVTAEAAVPLLLTAAGSGEREREGPPGPSPHQLAEGKAVVIFLFREVFGSAFLVIVVDLSSLTVAQATGTSSG